MDESGLCVVNLTLVYMHGDFGPCVHGDFGPCVPFFGCMMTRCYIHM